MWHISFDKSDRRKYLDLIDYVIDCINIGKLKYGESLPTQRELSKKLGLSIGTIIKAFKELERQGYLSGQIGRGTFVKDISASYDKAIDPDNLGISKYDLGHFKTPEYLSSTAQMHLLTGIQSAVSQEDFILQLNDSFTGGTPSQKEAMRHWLSLANVHIPHNDELVIVNSLTHATSLAILSFTKPGDVILVEGICNPVIKDQVIFHHRKIHGLAMDEDGIVPESLEEALKQHRSPLLITNPTLNNPTVITSSNQRRAALASIAETHETKVCELGFLDHFHEQKPTLYYELIPDHAVLVNSFTNSVNAAIRVGMIAGSAQNVEALNVASRLTIWMNSHISNEIASTLVSSGKALEILNIKKAVARQRNQQVKQVLNGFEVNQYDSAFHCWLKLPEHWTSMGFKEAAFEKGLLVRNSEIFKVQSGESLPNIRVSLGAIHSDQVFSEALALLADMLKSQPGLSRSSIVY